MTDALRRFLGMFRSATFRSASAGGVVSDDALASVRRCADLARFETFDLAHRGRYERAELALPDAVAEELKAIGSAAVGRTVAPRRQALFRLRSGDYSLSADDAAWTSGLGEGEPFLDVTLDASATATGEAEVVFTHRGVACFTAAQRPGELGLAERTIANGRYDRYLTHRVGVSVVLRLRVLLLALFALLACGCEPPCEPYWRLRCESCGSDSPACEHAKLAAKNELADDAQCRKMTDLAAGESHFTRRRYCELHVSGERSLDDLRGPWRCGERKLEFRGPASESRSTSSPQQIVVDGLETKIWNVQHASFQIDGAPACTYWLLPHEESGTEVGLAVSCSEPVGGLPATMVRCVK